MAALGKILRKGTGNGYNSVRYEPLNQDPVDNEQEDDDVVFVPGGKVNGSTNGAAPSAEIQELRNSMHEDIEVGDLGLQTAKVSRRKPPASDVEVKVLKQGVLTRTRIVCFIGSLVALVIFVVGFVVVVPRLTGKKILISHVHHNQTSNWKVRLDNYGTESCVRLFDVDRDGIEDVIFGTSISGILDSTKLHREDMKQLCRDHNLAFPCVGKIVALRGYDGKKLWELSTYMEVFEINCGNIDIDKDEKMDCIATGRMSTVIAFDPRKGTMLWEGDTSVLKDTWNTYNVLILPDFTKDGVSEVLLPHGGEPSFGPMEKNRLPGRLIVLDGATGKALGRYMEMPDQKELYSSPVLHTKHDGAQYVLFGHGGETIPGSFLALSLPDLWRYVKEMETNAHVPNTKGSYDDWEQKLTRYPDTSLLEIFRGTNKGVMVPAVLVEMTGDATKDILMSAYDSVFILYNGETLKEIWRAKFPGFETYSSPAPGYFTADDTLDFMLHLNKGEWPKYNYSLTIILDGRDGKVIWSLNSELFEMTSDLVARTYSRNPPRDAFVFRVCGRGEKGEAEAISHGVFKQDGDPQQNTGPVRRRRQASNFGRKSYRRPPAVPPVNQATYPRQQSAYNRAPPPPARAYPPKNPYEYPMNRPLPSERGQGYGGGGGVPQYSPQQYSPRFSPRPQYRPSDYYNDDDGAVDGGGGDDDGADYFAPEYDENGGLIVGEDKEAEAREQGLDFPEDGEIEETITFPPYESECAREKMLHTTEIFIMDRTAITAPIQVVTMNDYHYNYNLTTEERNKADDRMTENLKGRKRSVHLGKLPEKKDPFCTVMRLQEVNTAALGDLDGDGSLDMVAIFHAEGSIVDERQVFIHNHYETQIMKLNLEDVLSSGETVAMKPHVSHFLREQQEAESQGLRQMRFSVEQQPWSQYLGTQTDSIYH